MTTIHTSYATYYNCYSKKFVAANREHYPKATPGFAMFEKHNLICRKNNVSLILRMKETNLLELTLLNSRFRNFDVH